MSVLSSELFVDVHRGIREPLNKSRGLGVHWSAKYDVARRFSKDKTILHAQVPISSVETDTNTLKGRGVDIEGNQILPEHEVSLKRGAPVRLTGVTKWIAPKNDPTGMKPHRKRYRKYTPPRNMTA